MTIDHLNPTSTEALQIIGAGILNLPHVGSMAVVLSVSPIISPAPPIQAGAGSAWNDATRQIGGTDGMGLAYPAAALSSILVAIVVMARFGKEDEPDDVEEFGGT